jgi:RNA polymerase sporulation-specific sigma factor
MKLIRLSAKKSKMMNFDEVMKQYKNYLIGESGKWSIHYDFEELYQMASIGLWKAFKKYDGSVLFLTYASHCVQNEILMYVRKAQGCQSESKQIKSIVNLEATVSNKKGDESSIQDYIGALDNNIEGFGEREIKKRLLKKLSSKQLDEIECVVFKSIKQKDLGAKYGCSQSYASRNATVTLNRLRLSYLREMAQ